MTTTLPDWEAHWRDLAAARQREGSLPAAPSGDRFSWLAGRFERLVREGVAEDPLLALVQPLATGVTVLDVGAGAGRYTLPLAAVARRVVAVEPSEAMRGHLVRFLRERDVTNVDVVASDFERASLEPADLVLCAHVVHFVAEAPAFVRRIDALARHAVAFAIRHDPLHAGLLALWPKYRGNEGPPPAQAGFSDLYNLLLQLGYTPNVTFYARQERYGDADEVQDTARRALGMEVSQEDARALMEHPRPIREACVWWRK